MRAVELEILSALTHLRRLEEGIPKDLPEKQLSDETEIELVETVRAIRAALEKLINRLHERATGARSKGLFYPLVSDADWRARMAPSRDLHWLAALPAGVAEALTDFAGDGVSGPFNVMPSYKDAAHHGVVTYSEQRRRRVATGLVTQLWFEDEDGNAVGEEFVLGAAPFPGWPIEETVVGEGIASMVRGTYADFVLTGTNTSAVRTLAEAWHSLTVMYVQVMAALGDELGPGVAALVAPPPEPEAR